jgi:glucose/arabinose dehydrogenase
MPFLKCSTDGSGFSRFFWMPLGLGLVLSAPARAVDPIDLSDPSNAPGTQLRDIDATSAGRVTVGLRSFIQGTNDLAFPTDFTFDATGQAWVMQVDGKVKLVNPDGTIRPGVALDLGDTSDFFNGRDTGSTALELHPDFYDAAQPGYGKAYAIQSGVDKQFGAHQQGGPSWFESWSDFSHPFNGYSRFSRIGPHRSVLYEYTFSDPTHPTPGSATQREVLSLHQDHHGHNLGDLLFDDDGLLYVSSADGGNGSQWEKNSDAPTNVYGGILRIDPLIPTDTHGNPVNTADRQVFYGIDPDDRREFFNASDRIAKFSVPVGAAANPFATFDPQTSGDELEAIDLMWATGLRNPYRLSRDRVTGEMWSSETGQLNIESIEKVVAGGDHGWGLVEGDFFYLADAQNQGAAPTWIGGLTEAQLSDPDFKVTYAQDPSSTRNRNTIQRDLTAAEIDRLTAPAYTRPTFQWDHTDGNSSIGGFVYRGTALPELYGMVVFADFQGRFNPDGDPGADPTRDFDRLGGRLLYGDPTQGPNAQIHEFNLDALGEVLPYRILGLAEDHEGELLLYGFDVTAEGGIAGGVFELRPVQGDLNLDGVADLNDTQAMVLALTNVQAYEAYLWDRAGLTPGTPIDAGRRADFTGDGLFTVDDLAGFAQRIGTTPTALLALIPEPGAGLLLAVSLVVLPSRRRK